MKKTKSQPAAREIFGLNVRRARRFKEISQEELAFQAEISRNYLSDVERGVRNVSIDNMEALSKALGISLADLLKPDLFAMNTDDLEE
ncbi:helix-turn-helix transcriptional regulator [Herbaspirillum sp.]|uniref:helix-turn-helix domain-containing protein n=1 Tax=Herbaspirillum sp. TaxID=1890675 RepID=UPI001B19A552|nr:helix-turn-helix transcriptional regulator [Herbaspirillum sp.]MBO9537783.1 helix-turn-helix transcriptional regulator [Herbaspirillum sp.]